MSISHHRPDPQLDDLVHRLRVWSFASWEHGDRIERTRHALQQLADAAADADGRARRPVPELSPMALADQLAVLGADAPRAENAAIIDRLARDLKLRG
jgi:hypothetical protein